jgi:Uma2 family endonuclease
LIEYLLVAQHRPHVTQFVKQSNDTWLQREFNSIYDVVKLISLECELPLKEIYQDVIFPLSAAPTLNPFEPPGES